MRASGFSGDEMMSKCFELASYVLRICFASGGNLVLRVKGLPRVHDSSSFFKVKPYDTADKLYPSVHIISLDKSYFVSASVTRRSKLVS